MPTVGDVLTLEEIDDLLSGTRTRGGYKVVIKDHVASGNIMLDVTSLPQFAKVKPSAIAQSLKLNIAKVKTEAGDDFPTLACVVQGNDDKAKVYLINSTAHYAAKAAAALAQAEAEAQQDAQ